MKNTKEKLVAFLSRRGRANAPKGMTLLEIMIVIAILGLIASVVVVAVMNNFERAKANTAKLKIGEIHKALDLFKIDNNDYPGQSEGLRALTAPPGGGPPLPQGRAEGPLGSGVRVLQPRARRRQRHRGHFEGARQTRGHRRRREDQGLNQRTLDR
jgi:prepilin-type N-terminal cleavage/methylation domain-containing protein